MQEINYYPHIFPIIPNFRRCNLSPDTYRESLSDKNKIDSELYFYPNLLSSSTGKITLVNNTNDDIAMEIWDVNSRRIYLNGSIAPGTHSIELNQQNSIVSGFYLTKFLNKDGSLIKSQRMAIVK
jgi:hypothetical protein